MKDNKGVSLVEIIIVIAILAVLAGASIGGINYIRYANTKKCANELNAMIDKVRLQAMSKANQPCLYIYKVSGIYYVKVMGNEVANPTLELNNTGIQIANSQIQIGYRTAGMATSDITLLSDLDSLDPSVPPVPSDYIKLGFVKNTGGIADPYYNEIQLQDIDGTVQYRITLVKATGKHFIEKG